MTLRQLQQSLVQRLGRCKSTAAEARDIARILMEDIGGYSPTHIFVNGERTVEDFMEQKILAAAARVEAGEPVQYVVGSAHFMGMDLRVSPATLIPRPETAQLVDMVCDRRCGRADQRILDIGTGSGCIAIAVARTLPFCRVTAVDIRAEALAVARENGRRFRVAVDWLQADALALDMPGEWDVIVSNPPYVLDSEKATMDARVLDYEPSTALFVPDSDPLRYYTPIARYGTTHLAHGGELFFEINPQCASAIVNMLGNAGYTNAETVRDYRGAVRFVHAIWNGNR